MTRSQAIKKHCLGCAGESKKDVTLCKIVDCPLWPYRFGYSMNDKRFWARMKTAQKKYPLDFREMLDIVEKGRKTPDSSSRKARYDAIFRSIEQNIGSTMSEADFPK